MRQNNKKKALRKKDGERNLHVPSFTPDVQAALRETRRTEWKKWLNFNAGVILTDEEVRQFTEAGCEIYRVQWIEVDKNAHLQRDSDYVFVPAKCQSRLVGCGNFETTEGPRTDSPAGDLDSHNVVCSWCAQAHVSIQACDFTNEYFQGQEIGRISVCRIPAEGIPQEGIAGGASLASRVPVYGTKDVGRGLWLRLKNTCKLFNFSLNQIQPTLFTLRNEESTVIAVMSFQCGRLAVWLSPGRSRSHELCVATILGWQRRTRYLQFLWECVSTRRRLWHSCHG